MWFGQGNSANWDDYDNKMLDGCKDLRNGCISDQGEAFMAKRWLHWLLKGKGSCMLKHMWVNWRISHIS